jgi:hypothetical protein
MTTKYLNEDDLKKFLPTSAEFPDILEMLYRDVPISEENNLDSFLNLPVPDNYKGKILKRTDLINYETESENLSNINNNESPSKPEQ